MDRLAERLSKEYIQKLDALSYRIAQRVQTGSGGARRAKGRGNSPEFSDFRPYAAGDDIRRIDWNSYARFDKLFVKLYEEEKQAAVNFFVDTSESMGFGDGEKLLYAKTLAASLGYVFLKNTDRVNLFSFADHLTRGRGGLASKSRFYEFVNALEGLPSGGVTNMTAAFLAAKEQPLGSGISFVFSDFFSPDGFEDGVKTLAAKGQEIVLVMVLAKDEAAPALDGPIRLVDAETRQTRDVRVTADVLAHYTAAVVAHKTRVQAFCNRYGFGFVYADTSVHPLETVGKMM